MDNEHYMEVILLHKSGKVEIHAFPLSLLNLLFQCGVLFTLVGSSMNPRWKMLVRAISTAVLQATHLDIDVRISPQTETNI